jgi:hypothetical protein
MNENEMVQARWNCLRAAHKADLPALTVARAREFVREYPEKLDPKYVAARKALRDVRDTMRFSKEKRREEAARPASKLATAESRPASVEAEPVGS